MSVAEGQAPRLAALWQLDPEGMAASPRLSAAIWDSDARDVADDGQSPTNVLSLQLGNAEAEVFVDGKLIGRRLWRAGEVQVMPAGIVPRAVFLAPFRILHAYVPPNLLREAAIETGRDGDIELRDPFGDPAPTIAPLLRALNTELSRGTPPSRLMLDGIGLQLAVNLLRDWSNIGDDPRLAPPRGGLADWRLRRAMDLLDARWADDVGLAELAEQAGLSPGHFASLFRRATGLSPHQWLIRRRIAEACAMLGDPRRSVTEVALACGFASSQHFATLFRERMGITPSAYRRDRLM